MYADGLTVVEGSYKVVVGNRLEEEVNLIDASGDLDYWIKVGVGVEVMAMSHGLGSCGKEAGVALLHIALVVRVVVEYLEKMVI